MASVAFQDWVDRAKAATIESIVQARRIALKRHGANLTGPCPNCGGEDRFGVHVGKQQFHCRVCGGSGGGAISFVRFLDQCDFLHAVETITGEPKPADDQRAPRARKREQHGGRLVKTYDYTDEVGNLLFQVARFEPKRFSQRRPDPEFVGQWIWNLNGVRLVPYRLQKVTEAIAYGYTVFIVEGEKDADTGLERLNIIATTTPMGAGKWRGDQGDRYADFFRDADVVIIPDNDTDPKKGHAHAATIAGKLYPVAERVRVLTLPIEHKDLTVWVDHGGTREALDALVETVPDYMTIHKGNGFDANPAAPDEASDEAATVAVQTNQQFLAGFVAPDYIVDGMLQRRFVYSLTGQTGHAKTAIALLLAELISRRDETWFGPYHRVEHGKVVYFVGENPDDVRMRLIGAYAQRNDDPLQDDIWFIPGVFNIGEMMNVLEGEMNRLQGVDFVIVDTSAAYFLGDDELSNTQMGTHARLLRRLTTLPGGPCVLVLCHPIKHATEAAHLLPRGGGAFLAEMDGNLTAWKKSEDLIELNYTKIRGPGFQPMGFKLQRLNEKGEPVADDEGRTLKPAPKLVDAKGRRLTTVRAVAITPKQEEKIEIERTGEEDTVLVTLYANPNASFADIAEKNGWHNDRGEANRSRVQRAIEDLAKAKPVLLKKNRKKWELTEAGRDLARDLQERREREFATRPVEQEQFVFGEEPR